MRTIKRTLIFIRRATGGRSDLYAFLFAKVILRDARYITYFRKFDKIGITHSRDCANRRRSDYGLARKAEEYYVNLDM